MNLSLYLSLSLSLSFSLSLLTYTLLWLLDSALSSLYFGPLHGIMQGLMDNILKAPAATQQAPTYLYGSLLYFLTMTKQEDSEGQRAKGVLERGQRGKGQQWK